MRKQMVVLKETVETNMVRVENTVSELQGLEGMVGRCQELTQTITGISEELIGYIDEITDKKKQMAKEKRQV